MTKYDCFAIILFSIMIAIGVILMFVSPNPINIITDLFVTMIWVMYLVERIIKIRKRIK